ncbi:radical SAM protein [Malonomonas rubra]|uniref:B12-binding domain-containing radical SAM protein n=1 Tax=Malonomonas rubra TaxID=57040 RepID=UPI0026EFCCD5|nr:radical SAM protein [Malonomonas rubra]
MRILLPTLHVRRSAQAVPLAAGNLKASLPPSLRKITELVDLFPEQSLLEMETLLLAEEPLLIAFPLYLWNRKTILQLCRQLRQRQPTLFLIAGGPEASADAAAVLAEGELDGVICGEGELAFAQLATALNRGESYTGIPGLLTAQNQQSAPATCPDLSRLPSPWLTQTLPLETDCGVLWEVARGCTFNCAFCYDAKGQRGVRPLPMKRLREELRLFAQQGVAQIWVLDSTFNAPAERGKQLLRLLLEEAPQIHYHLEAKADFLDAETAELLSQLHSSVQIGMQSAEPEVLKPLHRTLHADKIRKKLQLLSATGVTFGLDLIYGLPNDNHQGFCRSLDFCLQQQPNHIDIFPLAVLPGTELYDRQQIFGIQADLQPPYLIRGSNSYPAKEMEQSRQLANATDIFYNRGRAVGFFLQCCEALGMKPTALLSSFANWLSEQTAPEIRDKCLPEDWQPSEILPLQQAFIAELLRCSGKSKLQLLAEDLINYHYCCAELLLAAECAASSQRHSIKQLQKLKWQLNSAVRLQKFNYGLEELETYGGEKLFRVSKQLTTGSCYGIFLLQGGEPVVEMLDNDFAQLLLSADGNTSTTQLLRRFDQQTGLELLQFAVSQGILQPI